MVPHSLSAIAMTWSLVCFTFAGQALGHDGSTKDHYNSGYWTGCYHAGGKPNQDWKMCVKSDASGSTWFHYVQCKSSSRTIFEYGWKPPGTNFVPINPHYATFLKNAPFAFTANQDSLQALLEESGVNWEHFLQSDVGVALPGWDAYAITDQGVKPGSIELIQESSDTFSVLFSPDKSQETIAWDAAGNLLFAQDVGSIKQMLDAEADGGLYLSCK